MARPLSRSRHSRFEESRVSLRSSSVAIVLRLERTFRAHAEIVRLLLRELRQLDAELAEVKLRDLLVELLRQRVDLLLVLLVVLPQLDLRDRLVREAVAHH